MIKLSQQAWNNVIIISMLMLIVLFNFSSNFLNDEESETASVHRLVFPERIITTIEFAQQTIERVGQGWRSTSGNTSSEALNRLIQQWRNAEVSPIEHEMSFQSHSDDSIKVWFAGQRVPTEYQFLQLADKTLVKIDNTVYQLHRPALNQLILLE